MSRLYKVLRAIIKPIMFLFFRIKYVGKENLPKDGGFILCCNHQSFMDVPFLGILCPRQIFFMAKQELFKNPIISSVFKKCGAFPVNRGVGAKDAILRGQEILKNGNVLGIFPEGKRYRDGRPKTGKAGTTLIAAKTGALIVPSAIYHDGKIGLFKKVTIRFGEPIPSEELKISETSKADIKRVTELIMGKITALWEEGHCK